MPYARRIFPLLILVLCAGALGWAVSFGTLPPAEFTFINGTEVQSLDPAIVTGQPEGRIINALFEGLYHPMPDPRDPHELRPLPGAAESCDISDDGKTYTFHMRPAGRWSDGEPVTADDFVWSWRRFLHPQTASEYAYQLHYAVGAARYTGSQVEIGDKVEVELADRRDPNQLFPRGTIVSGVLLSIDKPPEPKIKKNLDQEEQDNIMAAWKRQWVYTVDVKGEGREDDPVDWQSQGSKQRFSKDPRQSGAAKCLYVLYHWSNVGISATDRRTLVVKLNDPTPYFLDLVAFYPLYPVNRMCVETYGVPGWTKPGKIVSNGAFTMEFRRIRDRIRMVKNPKYWNAKSVALQSVDALAVESEATQLNMYMDGQVDWATHVPNTLIPDLELREDFHNEVQLGNYYYRINCRADRKPLDDHRVRAALNMALNKSAICQFVTQGGQKPARTFVPPGIPDYVGAECGEFDLAAAKKLLADAGYPNGRGMRPIEILYNTSEGHRDIAEVIQQQWKKLGIDVQLKNVAWGVYLDFVKNGKYDVARAGWIGDYPDPNTFMDMFVTDGTNNQTGWGNPVYDDFIRRAKSENDRLKRLALFHDAEAILMDNWDAVKDPAARAKLQAMRTSDTKLGGQPVVPIYYYVSLNMVRPYVRGVAPYDKFDSGFFGNVQDIHPLHILRVDQEVKKRVLREAGVR